MHIKIIFIFYVLFITASCNSHQNGSAKHNRIIDAESSMVLDGGSYSIKLVFHDKLDSIDLFIPNPSRLKNSLKLKVLVRRLNQEEETTSEMTPLQVEELCKQLTSAITDKTLPPEVRAICKMVQRILVDTDLNWEAVSFPERWISEEP